jgi:hypothetical protein
MWAPENRVAYGSCLTNAVLYPELLSNLVSKGQKPSVVPWVVVGSLVPQKTVKL